LKLLRFFAGAAFAVLSISSCTRQQPPAPELAAPEVWIMPSPWVGNGQNLRDMLSRGDEWKETRKRISGIGYWPYLLNQYHSDDEIRNLFASLRDWNLGFGFEVATVKAQNWIGTEKPMDAKRAFAQFRNSAARFRSLGMQHVDWFGMEEPIYAARHAIPASGAKVPDSRPVELFGAVKNDPDAAHRIAYGVAETVSFMAMMRPLYPDSKFGLIEPYPSLSLDELKTALMGIQKTCAEQGIKGLEFFRLDLDWVTLEREKRPWTDVKKIEVMCRENSIPFSVIFWAANWPHMKEAGTATPKTWSEGLFHFARNYREAGGSPDEIVIESWLWTPELAVPETDPDTFTGSALEFLKKFPPASWIADPKHP